MGYQSVDKLIFGTKPSFLPMAMAAGALGFPKGDPIVGLVITALVVYLLVREAAPSILARVMDRMDPQVLNNIRDAALEVPRVARVSDVRTCWMGHSLLAKLSIGVEPNLSVSEGHNVAEQVEHTLLHHISKLQRCLVHVEPSPEGGEPPHDVTSHHFEEPDKEEHQH